MWPDTSNHPKMSQENDTNCVHPLLRHMVQPGQPSHWEWRLNKAHGLNPVGAGEGDSWERRKSQAGLVGEGLQELGLLGRAGSSLYSLAGSKREGQGVASFGNC